MFNDLICSIPYAISEIFSLLFPKLFEDSLYFKAFSLLLYFKYKEFVRIAGFLQEYFSFGGRAEALFDLLSLIMKVLFFAHFYACIWHICAYSFKAQDQLTWLDKANITMDKWNTRYVYSLYFSITTMITVGYGDITPQNPQERLLCIFGMLVGSGLFGYSTNQIGIFFFLILQH